MLTSTYKLQYRTVDPKVEGLSPFGLYSNEYVKVSLAVRGPKASWDAQGGKDIYQIANNKVKEYDKLQPKTLPEDVQAKFDEIIESF